MPFSILCWGNPNVDHAQSKEKDLIFVKPPSISHRIAYKKDL